MNVSNSDQSLNIPTHKFSAPIKDLNLDRRIFHALMRADINTVSQIIVVGKSNILSIINIGSLSADRIFSAVADYLEISEDVLVSDEVRGLASKEQEKRYKSRAYVSIRKITDYLLSETYGVGKSKAKFFRSFGFDETNIVQFEQELVYIAQRESVAEVTETIYGKKYVIDGELETPSGYMIRLRTIWIIETGNDIPKLVTAHQLD